MTKFLSLTAVVLVAGLVTWTLGMWSGEDRLAPASTHAVVESTPPSFTPSHALANRGVMQSEASSSLDTSASSLGLRPVASTRASKEVFAEDVIARRAMSGKEARKPLADDAYAN